MDENRVLGPLWNVGCKVLDLESEIRFLEQLGGRLLLRETLPGENGPVEYAFLLLGDTRIFLTPSPIFESALPYRLPTGLTHAVFEVADHEDAVRRITAAGGRPLTEPRTIEAGFGQRRVAFFQSPGGLVFEALKIERDLM